MTYKLKISYDGSFFHGYAKQKDENLITVQSELEKYLSLFFNTKISTFGSGRTDKYVHAIDQTVSFKCDSDYEPKSIQNFLNSKLTNIYVNSIEKVPNSFHARFSIKSKTYMYVINTGEFDVFRQRYEYQYNKHIDIKKCEDIINLFIGTKDFLSFSTSKLENTTRTIRWIRVIKKKKKIYIFINGEGFLRNMVRMIVGIILTYCENKISYQEILDLFNNPKKGSAVIKVPGCGLYLYRTIY